VAAKSPAPPLTDEERIRRQRITDLLETSVGGYHYESIAHVIRCSASQARFSLAALAELGKVEQFDSFGNCKLWRTKRA